MSGAQSTSGFAADAPRYGAEPVAAYYQLNQTGQPTPVESVNGLVGQVVVQLNGTPIVPSGQNINIVAGAGVIGISAGGNTSNGTVPLASADNSVIFTNSGGVGGSIDFKAAIPPSRALVAATTGTGVKIVGPPPFVPPTTSLLNLTGLTVGSTYLLTVFIQYTIDPGVNIAASGTNASQQLRLGVTSSVAPSLTGGTAPYSALATVLYADINDIGALTTGTSNFLIPTQASAVVTATSTDIDIYIAGAGSTTTGEVKFTAFMQAVLLSP
jgi:hypothetical protein